jgi:hypothetical protein
MLRELINRFGGTRLRSRHVDGPSITGGNACNDASSGPGEPRQKTLGRPENSPHRDWRPRLYW